MRPSKNILLIILLLFSGFILQCASQQTTLMQDEFDTDSEIDAELAKLFETTENDTESDFDADADFLAKLDSYDPGPQVQEGPGTSVKDDDESLQEVLALLLEDDTEETNAFPSTTDNPFPTTTEDPFPATTDDPFSSTDDAPLPSTTSLDPLDYSDEFLSGSEQAESVPQFSDYAMENDIERLENEYENKAARLDSLKRLLADRDNRIQELENQKTSNKIVPQKRSASYSGPSTEFNGAYKNARTQFESKNYSAAIQSFSGLLTSFPNHRMADNCQYWLGESYFGMGQYNQAVSEFAKVFNFNQTDKYDDAQLMIALSYIRMGNSEQAKAALETFLQEYGESEYISVAKNLYQKL